MGLHGGPRGLPRMPRGPPPPFSGLKSIVPVVLSNFGWKNISWHFEVIGEGLPRSGAASVWLWGSSELVADPTT